MHRGRILLVWFVMVCAGSSASAGDFKITLLEPATETSQPVKLEVVGRWAFLPPNLVTSGKSRVLSQGAVLHGRVDLTTGAISIPGLRSLRLPKEQLRALGRNPTYKGWVTGTVVVKGGVVKMGGPGTR